MIAKILHPLTQPSSTESSAAWRCALGLVALLALLVLLGLHPHYAGIDEYGGNSDDVRATMFASGAGVPGGPSEVLLYSNRLIGKALCSLYSSWPNVPWYGIYLTGCHLLAHLVICFAWCRVSGNRLLRLAIAAFSLAFGSLLWIYLQFTTTSSLLTLAGVSLSASAVIREARTQDSKLELGTTLCGWCCVALAGLIRFHAMLVAGFVLLPGLLFVVACCWKRIAIWKHLTISVIASSTMFGLYGWSQKQMYAESEWRQFKEFEVPAAHLINSRQAISWFFDHDPLTPETEAALASVGWSHNDAKLFHYWLYFDEPVFSVEKVSQIDSALTRVSPSTKTWVRAIYATVRLLVTTPVCLLLLLLSAAILSMCNRRAHIAGTLTWSATVIFSGGMFLYMKLPSHLLFAIVSCAFFATLMICVADRVLRNQDARFPRGWLTATFMTLAVSLSVYKTWDHFLEARRGVTYRSEFLSYVEKLKKGPDNLYLLVLKFPFQRVSPYDTMQRWEDWHFLYTDGDLRSPRYTAFLEEHRIEDLTAALYSDSRVQIVTIEEKMKMLVDFLREHRGVETEYFVTQDIPIFKVFQLRQKDSSIRE